MGKSQAYRNVKMFQTSANSFTDRPSKRVNAGDKKPLCPRFLFTNYFYCFLEILVVPHDHLRFNLLHDFNHHGHDNQNTGPAQG